MDPVVLAGEPGRAQQLEGGDADLLALGEDADEPAGAENDDVAG